MDKVSAQNHQFRIEKVDQKGDPHAELPRHVRQNIQRDAVVPVGGFNDGVNGDSAKIVVHHFLQKTWGSGDNPLHRLFGNGRIDFPRFEIGPLLFPEPFDRVSSGKAKPKLSRCLARTPVDAAIVGIVDQISQD